MAADENPLSPVNLFSHVQDATYFHVPRAFAEHGHVPIPQIRDEHAKPLFAVHTGVKAVDEIVEPLDLKFTKFMVMEVVAATIIAFLFIRLAHRMKSGQSPRGLMWNLLESMVVFIREQVARPAIGKHDADRFVPLLLTMFFFVLGCNLLGMVPWAGSATGAFATTAGLALVTFSAVVGSGMIKLGAVGFWKAQVPHMELPGVLAVFLLPMIFGIEVLGLFIKHFVLAVRLLANMLAGHVVLAVLVAFIGASAGSVLWWGIMPASVLGAAALSMLELLVAFIQAYVFTLLSALFIGMAVHPH